MLRNRTTVKWQVLLDDNEWNSERCPPIPSEEGEESPAVRGDGARLSRRQWWGAVGLLFLIAFSVGYLLWWQSQAGLKIIEAELEQAIVLESWTAATRPTPATTGALQSTASRGPVREDVEMQAFDLRGDIACTQVVVDDPTLPLTYRETRFYRQTYAGWQRTSSSPEFLGTPQRLESEHFIFLAPLRDLATVAEAAPALDAVYEHMAQSLGLPLTGDEKLVLEIDVPSQQMSRYVVDKHLRIPSPSLLQIPVEMSDVEILIQLVELPLAHDLLNQAIGNWTLDVNWPMLWPWEPTLAGVRLWLVLEHDSLLAETYAEFVGWLHQNRHGMLVYQPRQVPQSYWKICQICHMLDISPLELAIPFSCKGDFNFDGKTYYLFPSPPTQLSGLISPVYIASPTVLEDVQALTDYHVQGYNLSLQIFLDRYIAGFTLIDYAIETYGEEHLPVLLAGLDTHKSWESLIPSVYDLSAEEFEAGWRHYLEEEYGL